MFIQTFVPLVLYALVIASIAVAVHFIRRGVKNHRVKSALKNKNKSIVKQNSRNLSYAKSINCLHSVDNFKTIYSNKNSKYCRLKSFADKLVRRVDTASANNNTKKKIQKANEKLELVAPKNEKLTPDWVREINANKLDKTTFIQCFDEDIAEDFKTFTDKSYKESKNLPFVCQMEYSNPNIKPLIVSSADKNVFKKGVDLLCEKILKISNEALYDVFPLTVKIVDGGVSKSQTYNSIMEFKNFAINYKTAQAEFAL